MDIVSRYEMKDANRAYMVKRYNESMDGVDHILITFRSLQGFDKVTSHVAKQINNKTASLLCFRLQLVQPLFEYSPPDTEVKRPVKRCCCVLCGKTIILPIIRMGSEIEQISLTIFKIGLCLGYYFVIWFEYGGLSTNSCNLCATMLDI